MGRKTLDFYNNIINTTITMKRKRALLLFGILIPVFLFVVLEWLPGAYTGMERYLYDLRDIIKTDFDQEREEIIIVDVDEKSLKELGRFQSWPRYYFGKAINLIANQKPSVIGIDIIFAEPDSIFGHTDKVYRDRLTTELSALLTNITSTRMKRIVDTTLSALSFDDYVSESIKKAGNVVLASYLTNDSTDLPGLGFSASLLNIPPPENAPEFKGMVTPISKFLIHCAGHGAINSMEDCDGVQRKSSLFFNYRGKTVPSLAFSVAKKASITWSFRGSRLKLEGKYTWLEDKNLLWINYQGDFKTFRYVSILDLLEENIPDSLFTNKIVLLGSSSVALGDISQTPFGSKLPSVEVNANIIHNLLFSKPIEKASKCTTIIFSILLVLLVLWIANKTPPYISPIITIIIMAGYFLFAVLQYESNLVSYEMSRPLLGIVFAFVTGLIYRIQLAEKEKRHIRDIFSRYVPIEVINKIIRSPDFALEGERREISVLLSDIRGFTARAEKESPEMVVEELNRYFEGMSEIVFQFGGMIDKYIGDGILCLFGAPLFHPGHADRAISCAIEMQRRMYYFNKDREKRGKTPLKIGIAINSGEVVIGNIGSRQRAEYTAIGDVVNTCARLEPLNKEYRTDILITEQTRKKLKGEYKLQSVGRVLLTGKSESTIIHTVDF